MKIIEVESYRSLTSLSVLYNIRIFGFFIIRKKISEERIIHEDFPFWFIIFRWIYKKIEKNHKDKLFWEDRPSLKNF